MNSNETTSTPIIPTDTPLPSQGQVSSSEASQQLQPQDPQPLTTEALESPLLSLPPGASVLAPAKPLAEMTDEELEQWHSRMRDYQQHQALVAHLRSSGGGQPKSGKKQEEQRDISEYL